MMIANPDAWPCDQVLEDGRQPELVAIELLDLESDPEQWDSKSNLLFNVAGWPYPLELAYGEAESKQNPRRERARIAAERIDHFIATDGAE